MCIVEGGMASSFSCSNSICPKSVWCYFQPLSDITIASFDYGIMYGPMGTFDYAISPHQEEGVWSWRNQVALGNFYSPKEYLALLAAQVSLGVSGCL